MSMECFCLSNDTQYYRQEWNQETGENLGGECVDIPECTAGTVWHPQWFKCEYREPCSDKEHYDEE